MIRRALRNALAVLCHANWRIHELLDLLLARQLELILGAENRRGAVRGRRECAADRRSALGDRAGELPATAGPEALRQVPAIVKAHSAGVLASMAGLASKAERLECIADIRDACEPAPSDHDEG